VLKVGVALTDAVRGSQVVNIAKVLRPGEGKPCRKTRAQALRKADLHRVVAGIPPRHVLQLQRAILREASLQGLQGNGWICLVTRLNQTEERIWILPLEFDDLRGVSLCAVKNRVDIVSVEVKRKFDSMAAGIGDGE